MAYANPADARAYKRRWEAANRPRIRAQQNAALPKRRAAMRASHLRRAYGLTPEQWDFMFDAQGRVCGLCGEAVSARNGFHTDHCHDTNELRAILCHACNTGIGKLKHNPQLLREAALYLEIHGY